MPRKFLLWFAVFMLTVVLTTAQIVQAQMGHGRMGGPGMGQGKEAQTIHQLFAYHDQIQRKVEEIPGGIRATTESENPEVAVLIQSHVVRMYDRVNQRQFIPMIGMSSTLPQMLRESKQYERKLRMTPKGIEVTETSNNPEIVAVIREHAQEVTQFAQQGMSAMMNGRMR